MEYRIYFLTLLWTMAQGNITEISLTIAQGSGYTSTDIFIGEKQVFVVTASFVRDQSTDGVEIALLPSVTEVVFALGDIISVTVGSGLTISNANFESAVVRSKPLDVDPTAGVAYDTSAVYDLGTVSCAAGVGPDSECQIVFEAEYVYVSMGSLTLDSTYWPGTGMQYDNGDYIYISQIAFTLKDVGTVSDTPVFTQTLVPTSLTLGVPAAAAITLQIPNPSTTVQVEAIIDGSAGDDVYVQEMYVESAEAAYDYSLVYSNLKVTGYADCPPKSSLVLDMGTIINKDSQGSAPDTNTYKIVVEMTLQADNPNIVGNEYTVVLSVDLDSVEIYIGSFNVTIADNNALTDFTTFTAAAKTGYETVSPGQVVLAEVIATIPPNTNHEYTLTVTTDVGTASTNALSILSVANTAKSNAINCLIPDSALQLVATESVPDSGVFDSAVVTFNVSNYGLPTAIDGDVTLEVALLLMPTATQGETHTISFDINSITQSDVTITGGAPQAYPTNVNYTFTLENKCSNAVVEAGGNAQFTMTVITERSVIPGPMTIEFPIPDDLSNSNLTYVSSTIVSKGRNLLCVSVGDMPVVLSDWQDGSGDNDRGVITLPLMCNIEVSTDSADDILVIDIDVAVKDVEAILAADTVQSFGIGTKFSVDKLWVASSDFTTKAPQIQADPLEVTGVFIPDGEGPATWPGDYILEWSHDNVIYYASYIPWDETPVAATGGTDYMLKNPLVGKYFRLIGGCRPEYVLRTQAAGTTIRYYGDAVLTKVLLQETGLFLDSDTSTCIDLPTVDSTLTPQYFWVSLDLVDVETNFTVRLVGNGITCNSKLGPQVTKVTHPGPAATHFGGKRPLCTLQNENAGPPQKCEYMCNCVDATTCADVSILMYHTGTPGGTYNLCDVQIIY